MEYCDLIIAAMPAISIALVDLSWGTHFFMNKKSIKDDLRIVCGAAFFGATLINFSTHQSLATFLSLVSGSLFLILAVLD